MSQGSSLKQGPPRTAGAQDVRSGEGALFQAIERDPTLSSRVAEEMERLIVDKHLAPGDRLLSERELGERFGVSRTVIREAVRSLSAKGLIDVRTGHGMYVRDGSHTNAAEALTRLLRFVGEPLASKARVVYEVRRPIEIAIAGLAAQRATAADIAELETWVAAMREPDLDEPRHVVADRGFHLALAKAAHNELFLALLDTLGDLMTTVRELGVSVEGSQAEGMRYHQLILDQIKAHDPAGAYSAMTGHMDSSEKILDAAIRRIAGPKAKAKD